MVRALKSDRLGMSDISDSRLEYHMANRRNAQSRRRKGIPSLGAGADWHYRGDHDWLWMSELARDLYRNNMILGSITDRAIENQLQGGFQYDPQTGDDKLNKDLKQWWSEVSQDPLQCDPAGELTFADQEEIIFRDMIVAGDVFGLPIDDEAGTVELIEGYRVRSPSRKTKERIVHGIEFAPNTASRRRVAAWILKDRIDPFRQQGIRKDDLDSVLWWDNDGDRNVFHVRNAKRVNQTRGITAYAPLFDIAGYHDDCQFLKMVQQRASSLFVFVRKRATNFDPAYLAAEQKLGVDVTRDLGREYEQNNRQYQEVAAGSTINSLPGEEVNPWSANVPNPEFFMHAKLLLTFMGVNLGMPLVMAMMDASETNFSGYRGAVDQARLGFRANQRRVIRSWHRNYMRFKIHKLGQRDAKIAALIEKSGNPRTKSDVFRHNWNPPSWPYIEPSKDAQADLLRLSNGMGSPTQVCHERGENWDDKSEKVCTDWAEHIERGIVKAVALKDKYPDAIGHVDTYVLAKEIAKMPMAERTQLSISGDLAESPEPSAQAAQGLTNESS